MTNKELFLTFAAHDFNKVTELLNNEYTETSEWKESLETLASSLEALLKDMDNKDVCMREKVEIQFGYEELYLGGHEGITISSDGGVIRGYVDFYNGKPDMSTFSFKSIDCPIKVRDKFGYDFAKDDVYDETYIAFMNYLYEKYLPAEAKSEKESA